jgi:hydroxyacylglutathione hydrolase
MEIFIKKKVVGVWKENSYLISSGNEAWLVDPGDSFEKLDLFFDVSQLKLKGIINTHGHFDHIGAVAQFKEKYNIPFYIHSKEKQLVKQGNLYRKLAGSESVFKTPEMDFFLDETPFFSLMNHTISVHHTPGHTNGSVCFETGNHLFTGDLFFKDQAGRTDLPGGNKTLLNTSIDFILSKFMGYMIHPGHGDSFILDDVVAGQLRKTI